MDKLSNKFYCEICERYYKSYQSLWNHNKKFHDNKVSKTSNKLQTTSITPHKPSKNTCEFCSKTFSRVDNMNRHKKKCELTTKKENELLKEKLLIFEEEMVELKQQLKVLINKKGKIHYKTLQKINKTGHIDTQNNIENQQNNINIIGFSKENLSELFSNKEKMAILNYNYGSLNKLIEYTHFNDKYPEFKNIKITNLTNNIAYKYDEHKKRFIATTKDSLITDLITNRMYDIETFSLEEDLDGQINKKNRAIIEKFIEQFYEDEELFVNDRKEDVKFIIYNGCEQ